MKNKYWLSLCGLLLLLSGCTSRSSKMSVEKEKRTRTAIDFSKTEEQVTEYIKRYIPNVTLEQKREWERSKSLECVMIDGNKRYFYNAAPNLFRIDKDAIAIKRAKDGIELEGYKIVNQTHVPLVVKEVKSTFSHRVLPVRMRVKYTLAVNANAVPQGEVLRCWLPFPRTDQGRQMNVKLIATNVDKYILAPQSCKHSSLYMEQRQQKDKPTLFSAEYEYTSYAEWLPIHPEDVAPYDTSTSLYREFTAEREQHIRFTSRIKELAQQIVGDEKNPYLKVKRIYEWINNIPWASAREYSTIDNIPEYVLDNKHGDCGQVSLLFITLARYCGVPAKFQSGFMMHPNGENMHDWAQVYFEGIGWVPVDQSFGLFESTNDDEHYFFLSGIDAYRMIVNDDFSFPLYPKKKFMRSETVDFQRGEVEWRKGNLYFNQWKWKMEIEYLTKALE